MMMDGANSFIDLKERLEQGEPSAGAEIFRRYGQQLIRLVSPRITGSLRQKLDAEDVVQSAFRSFFRSDPTERFNTESWNDLWAILATITLRKCRHQVRRFLSAKRNVNQENFNPTASWADWQAVARGPTPDEVVETADLLNSFLNGLDDRLREIAELSMLGQTPAEIANHLQLTERTVYRQLERLREKLADREED
jgi:RNA polymerase sigma-70 factor (ECF subfamily)